MFRLACAAPNCLMRTYDFTKEQTKLVQNNYTVTFHKFPRDSNQRLAWIAAAEKPDWKPSVDDSLCSLHFGDDCFDQASQLYDHAVPTIFFPDFRSHIKNLAKAIDLEVDFESSDDNEDILSKSLKSIGPLISDDTDDGEQIVECEISISDDDDSDIIVLSPQPKKGETFQAQKSANNCINSSNSSTTNSNLSSLVTPSSASTTGKKPETSSKQPGLKNDTKTGPSSTTNPIQNAVQNLFSMVTNESLKKLSITEPATPNFVFTLLNIVKQVNLQNNTIDNSVPNTYLITTKSDGKNMDQSKVKTMETAEIMSMVTNAIKSIKTCQFQRMEYLSIICGSPIIFHLKNVAVKNLDSNINSVYVVTSENLMKYLFAINEKLTKELGQQHSTKMKNSSGVHTIRSNTTSMIRNSFARIVNIKDKSQIPRFPSAPVRTTSSLQTTSHVINSNLAKMPRFVTPVNGSINVELKEFKIDGPDRTYATKSLHFQGTPNLLQNFGPEKQNVLKIKVNSPVPEALKIVAGAPTLLKLDLTNPTMIPKSSIKSITDIEAEDSRTESDLLPNGTKRKVDDNSSGSNSKKPAVDLMGYFKNQEREIVSFEKNILRHEREISLLKRKVQQLKKQLLAVKNPYNSKSDEQLVEEILNKYLDQDAVQFFISQMKVAGKTYTQFRWSEEDKLFALGLLYKHPVEYNVLFQKFTLPSDKTLSKFVSKIKKAEQEISNK